MQSKTVQVVVECRDRGDNMYIYRCEDTLESIFTAIYNVYEDKHSNDEVLLALDDEPRLFAVSLEVVADGVKVEKVVRTIRRQFGETDYRSLCLALASPDEEKAQAVYKTVAGGLVTKCKEGHLFDNLADDSVNKAFKLARSADREYCHLRGFVRFEELEGELMYSQIEPKNNVLTFLMPHFADRFPEENFIIHDVGRNLFGIHRADNSDINESAWCLVQGENMWPENMKISSNEIKYRELFKGFCSSIAIDSRRNAALQRNMLPLHFREFMTEFR